MTPRDKQIEELRVIWAESGLWKRYNFYDWLKDLFTLINNDIALKPILKYNKHMDTTEKTQNKLRLKIREWEIELGEKTKALYAQEPYKDLTYANGEIYKMIKGDVGRIEKNIEILEKVIEYGDNPTYTGPEEHPTEDSYDNDHDNKLVDEYNKE